MTQLHRSLWPSCPGLTQASIRFARRHLATRMDRTGTRACPSSAVFSVASRVYPTCGVKAGNDALTMAVLALSLWLIPADAQAQPEKDFLAGKSKECARCSLPAAPLKRKDLNGVELSGANLTAAVMHRARLLRAKLTDADLTNANLNKTDIKGASFARAKLEEAMLYESDASGADFAGAD